MYVMAIVALIGCEFNAERERLEFLAKTQRTPITL